MSVSYNLVGGTSPSSVTLDDENITFDILAAARNLKECDAILVALTFVIMRWAEATHEGLLIHKLLADARLPPSFCNFTGMNHDHQSRM